MQTVNLGMSQGVIKGLSHIQALLCGMGDGFGLSWARELVYVIQSDIPALFLSSSGSFSILLLLNFSPELAWRWSPQVAAAALSPP